MSVYRKIKDYIKSGSYIEASELINSLDNDDDMRVIFSSEILLNIGNTEEARDKLKSLKEIISMKQFVVSMMLARISFRLGEYNESILSLKTAEKVFNGFTEDEKNSILEGRASYYRISGNLFLMQTKLDDAMIMYEKALEVLTNCGLEIDKSAVYHNIGMVHSIKGEYEIANGYFESAILLWKDHGSIRDTSFGLEKMIVNLITLGEREEANKYLLEFEKMIEEKPYKISKAFYYYAKGYYLHKSNRINEKFESQIYYRKIINDDVVDNYTTMYAMIRLCQTLLDELKISMEEEVISELLEISQMIKNKADKFNTINIIFEFLLIQAEFSLIKGDLEQAYKIINEAITLSRLINIEYLRLLTVSTPKANNLLSILIFNPFT